MKSNTSVTELFKTYQSVQLSWKLVTTRLVYDFCSYPYSAKYNNSNI